MKKNKVAEVQNLLAEKGIKVAESAIIDAAMDLIVCTVGGMEPLEHLFMLREREREYRKYKRNKELGLRDNI